jgi:RNA polymerase sigma-70 factor (ECF subfamily)
MKYLGNEEDAKDQTQQICLKVLKVLPRHRVTYFKSWLYQVAKNHCLMELRQSRPLRILPLSGQKEPVYEQEWNDLNDSAGRERQFTYLKQALELLNEAQRKCLELFYLQKKTYQGVSEATGYSLLQAKSYIQNGKRNLRLIMERLASEGEAPEDNATDSRLKK